MHDPLTPVIDALAHPMQPIPTDQPPRLTPLPDVRAVLFDIYGTLLISGSGDVGTAAATDQQTALTTALRELDLTPPADLHADALKTHIRAEHARKKAAGIRFPEVDILALWNDLLTTHNLHLSAPQLEHLAIAYEMRINPTWPMPGLRDTLHQLHARHIPLGIVSNAQFYTPRLLTHCLQQPLTSLGFDPAACIWSYQIGAAKPATSLFEQALHHARAVWGLTPDQIAYVGNDRRNDIWPAAVSGCRTVLFAGDQRSLRLRPEDPDLEGVQPDAVITALPQLLTLLTA
jgi:putative hydrolase of the HAD superfamily